MSVYLELEIENHYEDSDMVRTHVGIAVPAPPGGDFEDDDWAYDNIFQVTGTGKEEGDAAYFVKVESSSDPTLIPVGTEWEFGL